MRQVIISLLGLAIIALGFFGMKKLGSRERPQRPKQERPIPSVFTQIVNNDAQNVSIIANGNLQAINRIEIFTEVQGVFEQSAKSFKPGVYYAKGEMLMQINSEEYRANIRAQKSNLYNQVAGILPDLRFDYEKAYPKWEAYVRDFDVNQPLPPLPKVDSEQEKLFIAGRNIESTWYNIKNLEERLSKYTLFAPFNGVLTSANVNIGSLVRAGQKMGEFISPYSYELVSSVNVSSLPFLELGKKVRLFNVDRTEEWSGQVSRINSLVDPASQTVDVFIKVGGKGLKEGMYMEAEVAAESISNAFEISRKLLVDNKQIYVYREGNLELTDVDVLHYTENTAIIGGLEDGTEILERTLPGAYDGMTVTKFEKN